MNGRSMFWSTSVGPAQVAVVDSAGKTVTIDITVLAKGQTDTALSIFPVEINAGDCTTNIPFVFTGGTPPFTVLTSDNFGAPVNTALHFRSDFYFTAGIRNPGSPVFPYKATMTVLDSQSRTAVSEITIDFPRICPSNALLQTQPASANTRVTELQTFQIIGGQPPYTVMSRDYDPATSTLITPPSVAPLATASMNAGNASFNVRANRVGRALITVSCLVPARPA